MSAAAKALRLELEALEALSVADRPMDYANKVAELEAKMPSSADLFNLSVSMNEERRAVAAEVAAVSAAQRLRDVEREQRLLSVESTAAHLRESRKRVAATEDALAAHRLTTPPADEAGHLRWIVERAILTMRHLDSSDDPELYAHADDFEEMLERVGI